MPIPMLPFLKINAGSTLLTPRHMSSRFSWMRFLQRIFKHGQDIKKYWTPLVNLSSFLSFACPRKEFVTFFACAKSFLSFLCLPKGKKQRKGQAKAIAPLDLP
jgi:hypothetical protein